jgi:hypothetical protein
MTTDVRLVARLHVDLMRLGADLCGRALPVRGC